MVESKLFGNIYRGKKVLVTGHTGFKGSWLSYWLTKLGALVSGYALTPETKPSHYTSLNLDMNSKIGDIRNQKEFTNHLNEFDPDIIFHLASQTLVLYSYKNPYLTYQTNIIGTLNLLEGIRALKNLKALINITTDKVYKNENWLYPYRENDHLGGEDPYSASKACVEILTNSYRTSYFNVKDYKKKHNILIATARAGNVIGGGDWANYRLIPDLVKACVNGNAVKIRNPHAVRPWQHVLDALSGYLLLGQRLLEGEQNLADAWNFGPSNYDFIEVIDIVNIFEKYWTSLTFLEKTVLKDKEDYLEYEVLKLDSSKALSKLSWRPTWSIDKTFFKTVEWYKNFYQGNLLNTKDDILEYTSDAKSKNLIWTR